MTGEDGARAGAENKPAKKSSGRWRWWFIGAGALVVVALMLGSAAGGWWLANQSISAAIAHEDDEPDDDAEPIVFDEFAMPDVRGLTRDDAAQVLADSGFSASIIVFEDTPSGTPEGIVVSQSPQFGATVSGSIVLGVAVPATMPAVAGKTRDAAISELSDMGVAVDVTFQYSADTPLGTVIGSTPAAGEALGETATLVVATAGASATLAELARASSGGNCRTFGEVNLGGEEYSASVACRPSSAAKPTAWQLGGKADRFTATVGISDTAEPGATGSFEVTVDGVVAASGQVAYGKPVTVDIPVTGALQLGVRAIGAGDADVFFGGASVTGADEAIAEIVR